MTRPLGGPTLRCRGKRGAGPRHDATRRERIRLSLVCTETTTAAACTLSPRVGLLKGDA